MQQTDVRTITRVFFSDPTPLPHITSHLPFDSSLSLSTIPSFFHSGLKSTCFTNPFHHRVLSSPGLSSQTRTRTGYFCSYLFFFCFQFFAVIYSRDAMLAWYILSSRVRLSVCPSVTSWYCIKAAKRMISQSTPNDSPMTLFITQRNSTKYRLDCPQLRHQMQ